MKPIQELIALTADETATAPKLCVHPNFIRQWRPRSRVLPDGRTIVEPGWEPSSGFIAAALAILRG